MAQAAGPSADGAHGITSSKDLARTAANAFTFGSPADRSVRKTPPAAGSKTAAAAQGAGAAVDGDIKIGLSGTASTARTIALKTDITTNLNVLSVVIDWGDGTNSGEAASGSTTITTHHKYAEVGSYTVKVTVYGPDGAAGVSATNEMPFITPGSEFTPHSPTRLLDTRDGTGAVQAAQVPAWGETRVKVAGNHGIPADVAAVVRGSRPWPARDPPARCHQPAAAYPSPPSVSPSSPRFPGQAPGAVPASRAAGRWTSSDGATSGPA
ncbi:hypothetical protein AB0G42_23035 [Streptomyces yangpuensis]|uniref:PKD domain-containing protein n=1 Tax=Streptomyces yangpuensis TaxID=1648182 RepID=UPI00341D1CA7